MDPNQPDNLPAIPPVKMELLQENPKEGVKLTLADGYDWFQKASDGKYNSLSVCRGRSKLIDEIVRALFEDANRRLKIPHALPLCILAIGGYGRHEKGLFSDLDILFLHDSPNSTYPSEVADAIRYPFWDNGLDVGATIRDLNDCIMVGDKDVRSLTSMLDARVVAGSEDLARRLFSVIEKRFLRGRRLRNFIDAKLTERERRIKRFGEESTLVEPNVKESEGGLRDYHTFFWIAKAAYPYFSDDILLNREWISKVGMQNLLTGIEFLWRIRNSLHLLMNKKNDRLDRASQAAIAKRWGYETEQLMEEYYRHSSTINKQSLRAIERIVKERFPPNKFIYFFKKRELKKNIYRVGNSLTVNKEPKDLTPYEILKIFDMAHENGLRLDAHTKELIIQAAAGITQSALEDERIRLLWKMMLKRPVHLHQVFKDMLECDCLKRWLPEFEMIIHRVQTDGFHSYTIETHSLRAVEEIGSLFQTGDKEMPGRVLKGVKNLHVLTLAVLLHDIGKGYGGGHAQIGAMLAADIAGRMHWSREEIEDLTFLVRNHMLLPTIAYRRDVKDPQLIERVAQIVKRPEILDMLYLVSFADVKSVSPSIWNEWKGTLLSEIYQNTCSHLKGDTKSANRQRLIRKKMEKVHEMLGGRISFEELDAFFAAMPDRYVVRTSALAISSHITMSSRLSDSPVLLNTNQLESRGYTELSVVTKDSPGLFSKIAGVLSINRVNIIDAQIFTLPEGVALDLLWVTDLESKPLTDKERWIKIERQLEEAIRGELDVHMAVKRYSEPGFLSKRQARIEPHIEIDNDVSSTETVVDIFANDRIGLLYDISRVFFDLGCSIGRAKITTQPKQVIDVFYIKGLDGNKITSRERLKQIKSAIENVVAPSK